MVEKLKKLLLEANSIGDNRDCPAYFDRLAKTLMSSYAFSCRDGLYAFIELEMYFYKTHVHEDWRVYPRQCMAGQLFFHYSGFDISFQTEISNDEKEFSFGGILIRSVKKIGEPDDSAILAGPLRCKDELLNRCPLEIVKLENDLALTCLKKTTRQGINTDRDAEGNSIDSIGLLRYFIPQDNGKEGCNNWNRKHGENVLRIVDKKPVLKQSFIDRYPNAPLEGVNVLFEA